MIELKYSLRQKVWVAQGINTNWKRAFPTAEVRVPQGWEHSLEVAGRKVGFSFVTVKGAKIPDGQYVMVNVGGTLNEAKDGSWKEKWYLMHRRDAFCPLMEEEQTVGWLEYLEANAKASFTDEQKEAWIKEKKLKIN